VLALAVSVGGCSASLFGREDAAESPATSSASGARSATDSLGVYLELMRALIEGDALTQAEIFGDVADAADFAPTTTNRLKYALALATPGHPGSDATLAEQRLSALLASADALLPEERMLVTIHLREVEQRLILDAAAAQLRSESVNALEQQNLESAAELSRALEENRRLRAELDDATQKLNALAAIEQSIRERENDSN
jgi:predicted RNA-binding Zn ribbon-like protein